MELISVRELFKNTAKYAAIVKEAYADYRIEQFEYIKKYLDVDFVMMHDDWGNQNNMFFSPEMWRKFFKEPERRMVKRAKELGMHYMHHSCGYIEPIIPDMVEIGIESWHGGAPSNNYPLQRCKG